MNTNITYLLDSFNSVSTEEAANVAVAVNALCKDTPLYKALLGFEKPKNVIDNSTSFEFSESVVFNDIQFKSVGELLKQAGIPAHLLGYEYLKTAIMMVHEDHEALNAVTKTLYPGVAKKHGTIGSRAERAIRHAIEVAYTRKNNDLLDQIIPCLDARKTKATNAEFIAAMAEYIGTRC